MIRKNQQSNSYNNITNLNPTRIWKSNQHKIVELIVNNSIGLCLTKGYPIENLKKSFFPPDVGYSYDDMCNRNMRVFLRANSFFKTNKILRGESQLLLTASHSPRVKCSSGIILHFNPK